MENVYKTRVINHMKAVRCVFVGFLVVFLVLWYLSYIEHSVIDPVVFLVGIIILLPFIGPAIFLHISYYIENVGLRIIIDESKDTLIVSKSGKEHVYHFADVILVEQHLAIYYRNRIDHAARRFAPWTPYGYLLLKFNDGEEVYLSCLMLDVLNSPIGITHTYFRFFPYMKPGVEFSEQRATAHENYKNEISHYKSNFKNHSDQQLNEKIINWKTYEKAAVEAARQLLALRQKD